MNSAMAPAKYPIWLTEKDVTSLIDLKGAINALETTLKDEGIGLAENMPKTHLQVGHNDAMHALGASLHREGICGTKTWVNINGKSETILLIFSLKDGACRAVFEATALGQLRTAAMTGLATRWMSKKKITEMAIIGTGKQALLQIAACATVRPIKRVRVFSRKPEKREKLVAKIRNKLPHLEPVNVESLSDAVRNVPLITLCTNSTEPFFSSKHAMKGAHINAIGAILPKRVEFDQDIFPRCQEIVVDSVIGVQTVSREFIDYAREDDGLWHNVRSISSVISGDRNLAVGGDITLFKSVGMGISDLAIASKILKSRNSKKIGYGLPERVRVEL